ncbi:MAG: hypothetical protein Q4G24_16510 [Paracoccus sp. (in: a-proteobacteria)]|uniref:hypothetical protein n=1 Tax=Paracoccus sp. TaxID=267 RepID=UPI0026E0A2D8|nr:hypothetical protein [Paracoccus sp. (in: a-proteobacteria)]MDO5623040.1 hypothetical protein [Paracoccus sp. (in: a-proteobacteria)]
MIDASTIEDIEKEIAGRPNKNHLAIIIFCRYRKDRSSLPLRVASNQINYHYSSGEDLDIYVPGFSFCGIDKRKSLGKAMSLKAAELFGHYHPKALLNAQSYLKEKISGFHLGSSVVAVAIEVDNGLPMRKNGDVINLSDFSAKKAEAQLMNIIEGCKGSQGMTTPDLGQFRTSFRLNRLVDFFLRNGWSAATTFSGLGALILK